MWSVFSCEICSSMQWCWINSFLFITFRANCDVIRNFMLLLHWSCSTMLTASAHGSKPNFHPVAPSNPSCNHLWDLWSTLPFNIYIWFIWDLATTSWCSCCILSCALRVRVWTRLFNYNLTGTWPDMMSDDVTDRCQNWDNVGCLFNVLKNKTYC